MNFFSFFSFLSFFRIRTKNEHMERDLVLLRDRVLNAKYNCLFLALALDVLPRGINNDSYKRNTVKPALSLGNVSRFIRIILEYFS